MRGRLAVHILRLAATLWRLALQTLVAARPPLVLVALLGRMALETLSADLPLFVLAALLARLSFQTHDVAIPLLVLVALLVALALPIHAATLQMLQVCRLECPLVRGALHIQCVPAPLFGVAAPDMCLARQARVVIPFLRGDAP